MSTFRRALWTMGLFALLLGLAVLLLVVRSPQTHATGTFASSGVYACYLLSIGWGFAGTGLYAWARRPGNAVGPLMTAAGFAWLLRGVGVSNDGVVFAIGELAAPIAFALVAHLLLAFPSGRLETRTQRALALLAYVDVTALQLTAFAVTDPTSPSIGCPSCPENPILVKGSATLSGLVVGVQVLGAVVVLAGLVLVLFRRWRNANTGQRRSLSPVVTVGALALFFLSAAMIAGAVSPVVSNVALLAAFTLFALIPFAFLLGLLRSRFGEAEAVTLVVSQLGRSSGRSSLRDALATALGDPELEIAYWVPEISCYVDSDGNQVVLPESGSSTMATSINHEGEAVAVLIHDAALEDDGELLHTLGAAVVLTLRNERLDAELRVRVAELRASRARIVEAGDHQRRRIERDLHDGAQQRLMALGINLRLALERVEHDPGEAIELLETSLHELGEATAELRELARGIHPAVLTDRGLGAALNGLAGRSPVPVEVAQTPGDRLPARIESAVYFVVAEALTNAARYATAHSVTVTVFHRNGEVEVEVTDDGVGGADPKQGSGLRGLQDRVGALDGRLELVSPSGEGTIVRVSMPCG